MPTFSNIGLAEPSTITNRVGAVTLVRGTTNEQQEVLCLGDPDTTNAIAAVLAAAPASTAWGLVTRIADPSTTVNVSSLAGPVIVRSSAADALVTVSPNSTAAPATNDTGVIVRQVGYSTTVNISSLAGRALVDQNSTVWPVQVSSLAGRALADQNSTVWFTQSRLFDSTGLSLESSTNAAPSTARGLVTREAIPDSTTVSGVTVSTGSVTIISSATTDNFVFAFALTVNSTIGSTVRFVRGSTSEAWRYFLQAPSSAGPTITGANLPVTPPGYIFRTGAGQFLALDKQGSSASVHYSVAFYRQ